jgi:hypothetical protein
VDAVTAICTRNRPHEIAFLVRYLDRILGIRQLIIVDSSDSSEEIERYLLDFPWATLVSSEAGLPLQRNKAIRYVRENYPPGTILHFIDDDVIPSHSYFGSAESLLRGHLGHPLLVASWDQLLSWSSLSIILMFLRIKGEPGFLGAALLPTPPSPRFKSPVWGAGHGFSFVPSSCEAFAFSEEIDFFGEDLDATLRFSKEFGSIECLLESSLLHIPARRNGSLEEYDRQEVTLRKNVALRYFGKVRRGILAGALFCEGVVLVLLSGLRRDKSFSHMARVRFSQIPHLFRFL